LNFLGHLFFSGSDHDLMYANLFGDFVRGSDFTIYSNNIVKGIKLHRSIDDYFNRHHSILTVQRQLYKYFPKVSGIAMDLYADHWLAKNWKSFHNQPYKEYLRNFYSYDPFIDNEYPDDFIYFIDVLKSRRWMDDYPNESGLFNASNGLSKRLSFPNNLGDSLIYYKKYEKELQMAFQNYFKDAIKKFL